MGAAAKQPGGTGLNSIVVPCQFSYGPEKKSWINFIGINKSRIICSSTNTQGLCVGPIAILPSGIG